MGLEQVLVQTSMRVQLFDTKRTSIFSRSSVMDCFLCLQEESNNKLKYKLSTVYTNWCFRSDQAAGNQKVFFFCILVCLRIVTTQFLVIHVIIRNTFCLSKCLWF